MREQIELKALESELPLFIASYQEKYDHPLGVEFILINYIESVLAEMYNDMKVSPISAPPSYVIFTYDSNCFYVKVFDSEGEVITERGDCLDFSMLELYEFIVKAIYGKGFLSSLSCDLTDKNREIVNDYIEKYNKTKDIFIAANLLKYINVIIEII